MSADATIAALSALSARLDAATEDAVGRVAAAFNEAVKAHAPIGRPGNTTNPPGDLAASVVTDGPHALSAHSFEAEVGPTTVYARQRELGGPLPVYKIGALMVFTIDETTYFRRHVDQVGAHYTLDAYTEVRPTVNAIVSEVLAEAIA